MPPPGASPVSPQAWDSHGEEGAGGDPTATAILADHAINIEAVFQAPWDDKSALPFVITLEPVAQSQVDAALGVLGGHEFNVSPPLALPTTP